ncbi:MAG: SurA N-terminal domain-containing protein [Acidobacteriaceae bacterium]|nr:SurA N-terminal domain-containing protein [Acidobacteriaceae bacterium]
MRDKAAYEWGTQVVRLVILLAVFVAAPFSRAQEQGTVLDRVVAVVNGDAILESDIDEERRFANIQPYRSGDSSRESALDRIISRTLIQQEARLQPNAEVSNEELDRQLSTLRSEIPACKQSHCETDEGWQKYLAGNGFTPAEFRELWRSRMQLFRFIQIRFRGGVHITDDQIREYYEKTMLPEYERQKVAPPKLETISQRIEEVLLQQQVTNLMRDWLASLRAQGSVRILKQDGAGQ